MLACGSVMYMSPARSNVNDDGSLRVVLESEQEPAVPSTGVTLPSEVSTVSMVQLPKRPTTYSVPLWKLRSHGLVKWGTRVLMCPSLRLTTRRSPLIWSAMYRLLAGSMAVAIGQSRVAPVPKPVPSLLPATPVPATVVTVSDPPDRLSLNTLFLAQSAMKRLPALSMVSRAGAPRRVEAGP